LVLTLCSFYNFLDELTTFFEGNEKVTLTGSNKSGKVYFFAYQIQFNKF